MRLTVLGGCGTYPAPGRACSGYLLEGGGARIWVDTGTGTLSNLLRHTTLTDLDAVWVSHLHADHCSDLPMAYYALRFGEPERPPLPVYGPGGWADRMDGFLTAGPGALQERFEVNQLHDGAVLGFGGMELTAVPTVHGIETYGVRAQAEGRLIAYTADSGPCEALDRLAKDADVLLSESSLLEPGEEDEPIHLSAGQAAGIARAAGARRLVLTHLPPAVDAVQAVARAEAVFGAPVGVALEGDVFEAGAPA